MTLAEWGQLTAVVGTAAQWCAFAATIAAVIVALFKEGIIRRLRHPELRIKLEAKHPYIVRTPIRDRESNWSGWRYFIRLRVKNTGKVRADKVEVFLPEALILHNGSYRGMPNFTPTNLRWSYGDYDRPTIYADGIPLNWRGSAISARFLIPSIQF
jgi:hypothetical protein